MPNYRLLDVKYLLTKKIWLRIKGKLLRNGINVFYVKWSNNFGDLLTPIILKHYGFTPIYAYPQKAQAVIVGTILEIVKTNFNGYILGSGWSRDSITNFPFAKIKGVRGYLTKDSLQINKNIIIGDPGLLMSDIFPCHLKPKFQIGIIPHESEINDPRLKRLKQVLGDKITIINPCDKKATNILKKINECQYIVSSSLHGLIISDSYSIPNGRIKLNELDDSNDYKFRDYYSSLFEDLKTLQITGNETIDDLINICRMPPLERIEVIKKDLNMMFIELKNERKK